MKRKVLSAIFALMLCASSFLSGCAANEEDMTAPTQSDSGIDISDAISLIAEPVDAAIGSEDRYFDWSSENYKTVILDEGPATISQSGIYEIKGTLADGSLTVDVNKDTDSGIVYLVLNGADISSSDSAPIYILDAEKVVIILESGSVNSVYQGSGVIVTEDAEPSAAIFSKADLTITGSGSLSVTSDYNDGITSRDSLVITDATLNIKAVSDGIVGKDMLAVEGGDITIEAGKDGMRSTNDTDEDLGNVVILGGSFNITSGNDGIQAERILQIDSGTFNIVTGGGYTGSYQSGDGGKGEMPGDMGGMHGGGAGVFAEGDTGAVTDPAAEASQTDSDDSESCKALKGVGGIIINGGSFYISAVDDAVHSGGDILINAGTLSISTDDDGIHSDTSIYISSGEVTIANCYEGIEAPNISISGGSIDIKSGDDGFNVNSDGGLLSISGGQVYMDSDGDGLDSNGSVEVTGGEVFVDGPISGANGSIDYAGSFFVSEGVVIASGSSQMAQAPDGGTQPSVLMYYSGTQAAGTTITLKDAGGNTVAEFTPSKEYASVAISAPELIIGSSYTLCSGNAELVSFEISELNTFLNESGVTENQGAVFGGGTGGGGGRGAGSFPVRQ